MITVTLDKRALQMAGRFAAAKGIIDLEIKNFVEQQQKKAVATARKYLNLYVYDTSQTANSRRTHLTYEAVKAEPVSFGSSNGYGMVHINRGLFPTFYYPFILNRGRSDIHYQPRPFWKHTIRDMRGTAPKDAKIAAVFMGRAMVKGISPSALIEGK
jgi:hypothetical protein